MPENLAIELMNSAYKLVKDVMKIKSGEEVVITADTESDWRVVEAVAEAVALLKAKPLVAWISSPPGVGKAADPYIPIKSLTALLKNSDVWIEFNKNWLLYSTPYEEAMKMNRIRYICLVGMDTEMMVRNIGMVDIKLLYKFQRKLADITRKSKYMKITSKTGMDVEFENDPTRPVLVEGEVFGPGEYMLFGQVDWAPIEESINGVIVFDGSIWPPKELGLLNQPVKLYVKNGEVIDIKGEYEAVIFKNWLKSFNDDKMFRIAHISYGCNPGARLKGNILEDERVWGVVEWGLGSQSSTFKGKLGSASSHTDGICMNPTVFGDDIKIIEDGEYIHPELIDLSKKLRFRVA